MNKILALTLTILLILGILSSCTAGNSTAQTTTQGSTSGITTKQSSTPQQTTKQDDYSKEVSFSMNVIYTDRVQEDPRTQFVLDKFNVDIDFIACSSTDYVEKSRLWIAGGDMPNVMWTAFGVSRPEHVDYVKSGQLRPWPSLDEYPNLKTIQDSIGEAVNKSIELNGDRYFYFTEGGYMNTKQYRSGGLYYRVDWAEKLGLLHDDHNYTWDEVMELAIAFSKDDPGENGAGNTIGFTSIASGYPSYFGFVQNANQYSAFVEKDGAYHWRAGDSDVLDAIKDLKYMYDNGAIWEEQIMAAQNDGVNKMIAGLAGICGNNWHMGQVEALVLGLHETYKGSTATDLVSPMYVINNDGTFSTYLSDGYWGEVAISSTISDEALDRFLDMFEWLGGEEGYLLSAIGIKGVDYDYNNTGNIEIKWERDQTNSYVNPYQVNAHRFISLPRLYEGYALESPASNETAKVLGNRMNDWIQASTNKQINKTDWNIAALTSDDAPLYRSLVLSPNVDEKIKELVISSTADNIINDYMAWIDSVRAQITPVEDELTKIVFG